MEKYPPFGLILDTFFGIFHLPFALPYRRLSLYSTGSTAKKTRQRAISETRCKNNGSWRRKSLVGSNKGTVVIQLQYMTRLTTLGSNSIEVLATSRGIYLPWGAGLSVRELVSMPFGWLREFGL